MATNQPSAELARDNKKANRRMKWFYIFIHVFRLKNFVIRKLAFKPPIRHGYTLDEAGNMLIYDSERVPVSLTQAMSEIGLRLHHDFTSKNERERISIVVLHQAMDFESPDQLSAERPPQRPFLLLSHGNSTDIGYMFSHYVNLCHRHRINVVSYDYSGYGLSGGKVGEKQLHRNAEQVYKYMREKLHTRPEQIILYGNSLGSVPSSYLASKPDMFPVGGLVLDAPLASALRLQLGGDRKMSKYDVFKNVEYLKKKALYPTLFIHGTADNMISIRHSYELYWVAKKRHHELLGLSPSGDPSHTDDTASVEYTTQVEEIEATGLGEISLLKEPEDYIRTWWVQGANHNNVVIDHADAYRRVMDTFFQLCAEWRKAQIN